LAPVKFRWTLPEFYRSITQRVTAW